jgi:acetyl-CoA carboxylase biotin carboxyl carrier protein
VPDSASEVTGNGHHGTIDRLVGDSGLRLLREEVGRLVRDLPGSLSAVTARIGDTQLEITWARQPSSPPAEPAVMVVAATQPDTTPPPQTAHVVAAPLVGTFYRAPEVGARPFVEVGDQVTVGQPIGIVEAMKLMNRVESEWAGTVVEVLVTDATAVEFGQPLVRIDPEER